MRAQDQAAITNDIKVIRGASPDAAEVDVGATLAKRPGLSIVIAKENGSTSADTIEHRRSTPEGVERLRRATLLRAPRGPVISRMQDQATRANGEDVGFVSPEAIQVLVGRRLEVPMRVESRGKEQEKDKVTHKGPFVRSLDQYKYHLHHRYWHLLDRLYLSILLNPRESGFQWLL